MSSSTRKSSPSDGFTLVELLVVIGIIALLISILLPTMNKARQAVLDIKCLSNLRQIGQAAAMYQSNNKGLFPLHAVPLHATWDRSLAPYLGVKASAVDGSVATPAVELRVLQCPRERRPAPAAGLFTRSYTANAVRTAIPTPSARPLDGVVVGPANWVAAAAGVPAHSAVPLPKVTQIRRPSDVVFLFERLSGPTSPPGENTQWTLSNGANVGFLGVVDIPRLPNGDIAHHGRKMSILWVDGHASLEDPNEAFKGNTPVNWWARTY